MLGVVQSIQLGEFNGSRKKFWMALYNGECKTILLSHSYGRSGGCRQGTGATSKSQQIEELEEGGCPVDSW